MEPLPELFGSSTAFVAAYIVQVLKPFNRKQRQPLLDLLYILTSRYIFKTKLVFLKITQI